MLLAVRLKMDAIPLPLVEEEKIPVNILAISLETVTSPPQN